MKLTEESRAQLLALLHQWGIDEGLRRFGECGIPVASLDAFEGDPALLGWVIAARAFEAMRERRLGDAHRYAAEARERAAGAGDRRLLEAAVAHCEGTLFFHEGKDALALSRLNESLERYGKDHFLAPRVIDTLGMVYSSLNNCCAARDLFEESLKLKSARNDRAGLALTHGQLGRLFFDWGEYGLAHRHFGEDLRLSHELGDHRGCAQMLGHLSRAALAMGRTVEAHTFARASLAFATEGKWPVVIFFALKDNAYAERAKDNLPVAKERVRRAGVLLNSIDFPEGRAHLAFIAGLLEGDEGLFEKALVSLRIARSGFDAVCEQVEAARVQLEVACMAECAGEPHDAVVAELLDALDRAEQCRRGHLVRAVEEQLARVDPLRHCLHGYRRARGRAVEEDTVSLVTGVQEEVTVIFLDLQGFTDFSRGEEPEAVFLLLNQIFYDLSAVMERHSMMANQYLGDGFMAVVRGDRHALRAVDAAWEMMEAIDGFNAPRRVLALPVLCARVGVNTGAVFLGNVGTYHKIDFTAIGTTTNMASRIQHEGVVGVPCISASTHEQVKDHFVFGAGSPRTAHLKGLGEKILWDVTGRRGEAGDAPSSTPRQ